MFLHRNFMTEKVMEMHIGSSWTMKESKRLVYIFMSLRTGMQEKAYRNRKTPGWIKVVQRPAAAFRLAGLRVKKSV